MYTLYIKMELNLLSSTELNLEEFNQLNERLDTLYHILTITLCIVGLVLILVIVSTIFILLNNKKTDEKVDNLLEYHELKDDII